MRVMTGAAIAALALGAGVSGCGGDDGDGGDGGGAGNPEDLVACVEDEGLSGTPSSGADEQLGLTGSVQIDVQPNNRIIVNFFDSADDAESYSEGQGAFLEGAGGGSSEIVGETTVVGVARSGADEQVEIVKDCLS